MPQVEIGKEVNEVEGHEREAEDNTDPFLTSFALKKETWMLLAQRHDANCCWLSEERPGNTTSVHLQRSETRNQNVQRLENESDAATETLGGTTSLHRDTKQQEVI